MRIVINMVDMNQDNTACWVLKNSTNQLKRKNRLTKTKDNQNVKRLLIEVKIHEENTQEDDDKKISFNVFQLVLPLLKLRKKENQIDGICALNEYLIEKMSF